MKVHPASLHDRVGVKQLITPTFARSFPEMKIVFLDAGYQGQGVKHIEKVLKAKADVVKHPWSGGGWVWCPPGQEPPPIPKGFHLLRRRWVVERTFAWLGRNRRLSKDYEQNPSSSEAWVYLSMCRLMLRRMSL